MRLRMKNIALFAGFFATRAAAADGYVANVECSFQAYPSFGIEKIVLTSVKNFSTATPPASPGLTIHYSDGQVESLLPTAKTDPFGQVAYTGQVDFVKGRLYFPASKAGEIYLNHQCFHSAGIPWDRCMSQGTGEHGKYSGVAINVGGHMARFLGGNLCQRSVMEF